jgi:hypothetical protein
MQYHRYWHHIYSFRLQRNNQEIEDELNYIAHAYGLHTTWYEAKCTNLYLAGQIYLLAHNLWPTRLGRLLFLIIIEAAQPAHFPSRQIGETGRLPSTFVPSRRLVFCWQAFGNLGRHRLQLYSDLMRHRKFFLIFLLYNTLSTGTSMFSEKSADTVLLQEVHRGGYHGSEV